ncbi:hypothetical protein JCM8097_002843 [Rhodosporidiobolus ruineniae]
MSALPPSSHPRPVRSRSRPPSSAGSKPSAPPPALPLPPLPPTTPKNGYTAGSFPSALAGKSTTSPQLPPLPPLPSLGLPSLPSLPHNPPPAGLPSLAQHADDAASPASSHFSGLSSSGFSRRSDARETVLTRPSSADSTPTADDQEPKPRLERAKSVTVEGFDFDLVTPHLGPSMHSFGPHGDTAEEDRPPLPPSKSYTYGAASPASTAQLDADGEATTPRASLVAQAEAEAAACGCDVQPVGLSGLDSPLSSDGEYDDDDYDEEAERLLQEAGLGGLGLGLLRRQSEAVQLARQSMLLGPGGRRSVALIPASNSVGEEGGAELGRSTTPPDAPPDAPPPLIAGAAATKLIERRAKEKARAEKKARRRSKDEFDRFSLPVKEAVEAARRCELLGEGGVPVTFNQLIRERKKKVIVVFLRHAWCGLCQQFVEALNRATANLSKLASSTAPSISSHRGSADSAASTMSTSSPVIPPLYILLISSGSATLIPTYRARLDCPFPLYMDRSRKLYKALGMNKKTWDMGSDKDKGSYIVKSNLGNVVSSTKAGLAMPHYPGSQTQLGGEFVFSFDPATDSIQCDFAQRMSTTRNHAEIRDIFKAAGVVLSEEDEKAVYNFSK